MMTRIVCVAGLAVAMLLAAPAQAWQDPTTVEEVTVTATKKTTEQQIDTLVKETTVKTPTGQIGRWNKDICPTVSGFPSELPYNDIIRNRIVERAGQIKLTVGQPGCKPNLIVIAAYDPDLMLKASAKKNKKAFLDDDLTLRLGQDDLNEFLKSDLPVRTWFVTKRVTWEGKPYRRGAILEGRGRVGNFVRADFSHAFVVLSGKRIGKVPIDTLADYVAMVSLMQISPDAQLPQVPTVLTLFENEDRAQATGMSPWDTALLMAVYNAPRDAKRQQVQQYEMQQYMKASLVNK